jgi:putative transposase
MTAKRNLDAYEARRLKGLALYDRGFRQSEVAGQLHVSRQAVSQWVAAWTRGGKAALARVRHPGRPPSLRRAQRARLIAILRKGAVAQGYPDERWTGRRVSDLIHKTFLVHVHPKHVPRMLRSLSRAGE